MHEPRKPQPSVIIRSGSWCFAWAYVDFVLCQEMWMRESLFSETDGIYNVLFQICNKTIGGTFKKVLQVLWWSAGESAEAGWRAICGSFEYPEPSLFGNCSCASIWGIVGEVQMVAGAARGLSVSNGKCPILSKFSAGSGVSVSTASQQDTLSMQDQHHLYN